MTAMSNLIVFIDGEKCFPATLSARHMGIVGPMPNVKFSNCDAIPRVLRRFSPYCFSFRISFTVFAKA